LAPRSRALYREQLDNDILPFLGDKKVSRVKPSDLDAYLAHLQRQGRAVSTQRRHLSSILSGMFSFAVKRQMIAVSPTKAVRAPRLDDGERRFLSMGELRHLASCFPPQWQGMILFTGIMGPRWSEVWALRPEHVSPDGRTITIPGTKTRASRRRVAMPEVVRSVVAGQLWFWATPESLWGPVTSPEAWRATVWRRALAKSGLAPLRFHDLRHTAAALAIHAGANPVLVQRRLGHANITVTLGTYAHLFPAADESVVGALDELWQRGSKREPGQWAWKSGRPSSLRPPSSTLRPAAWPATAAAASGSPAGSGRSGTVRSPLSARRPGSATSSAATRPATTPTCRRGAGRFGRWPRSST